MNLIGMKLNNLSKNYFMIYKLEISKKFSANGS